MCEHNRRFPMPELAELGYGQTAVMCPACRADDDADEPDGMIQSCEHCTGGYNGVDGTLPTTCPPGSVGRIVMYRVRDSQGLSIYNDQDVKAAPKKHSDMDGYERRSGGWHSSRNREPATVPQ